MTLRDSTPNLVKAGRLLARCEHLRATRTRGGFDRAAALVWSEYEAELRRGVVPVKLHNVSRWLRKRLNDALTLQGSQKKTTASCWSKYPNKFVLRNSFHGTSMPEKLRL